MVSGKGAAMKRIHEKNFWNVDASVSRPAETGGQRILAPQFKENGKNALLKIMKITASYFI